MAERNLYYTINGTNPSTDSTVYSSPFEVNHGTTVKAIAESGGQVSGVSSAIIAITLPVPVIDAWAMGVVTISNAVGTVRYTIDGSGVTESSPVYTNLIQITKSGTTLKVRSYYKGAVSSQVSAVVTFVVFTPTITVNGSTFSISRSPSDSISTLQYKYGESGTWVNYTAPVTVTASQEVWARAIYYQESSASVIHYVPVPPVITRPSADYAKITTDAAGASIYYTTNGSTPTSSSTKYTGNIPITSSVVIKALVVWHNQTSGVSTLNVLWVTPPTIYANSAGFVTMIGDGTIYYTVNGGNPTTGSSVYSSGFLVSSGTVIKAMCVMYGALSPVQSTVVAKTVTVNVKPPALSISRLDGRATLTQNLPEAEARIMFTLDGSDPSVASILYSSPFNVPDATTVKAITVLSGVSSSVVEGFWCNAPSFTVSNMVVTIDSRVSGSTVYYTTNGSEPTPSSPSFTTKGSVTLSGSATVKAYTVYKGFRSETGQITVTKPITPGISITKTGMITISNPSNGDVYYTLDGSTPTKETGTLYTTTFASPTGSATVKAISVLSNTASDVATAYYVGTPSMFRSFNDFQIISQNPQATTYYDSVEPTGASPSFTGYQKVVEVRTSMTMHAVSVWNGFRSGTAKLSIEVPPAPALELRPNGIPSAIRLIALDPVHYTTDGSVPDTTSSLFPSDVGFLVLPIGTVVKAIAVRNYIKSAMVEGTVI